jgi:hypothetical protein
MHNVPPEIFSTNILSRLEYHDIMMFCQTSRQAWMFYTDLTFWKTKLDKDFYSTGRKGIEHFIPSTYVTEHEEIYRIKYGNVPWNIVYKRWYHMVNTVVQSGLDFMADKMFSTDIVTFRLDRNLGIDHSLRFDKKISSELIYSILDFSDINILSKFVSFGSYADPSMYTGSWSFVKHITPKNMNLLVYRFIEHRDFAVYAALYGRADLLAVLFCGAAGPWPDWVVSIMRDNQLGFIQWFAQLDIIVTKDDINKIFEINSFYFLQETIKFRICSNNTCTVSKINPLTAAWLKHNEIHYGYKFDNLNYTSHTHKFDVPNDINHTYKFKNTRCIKILGIVLIIIYLFLYIIFKMI